MKKFLENLLGSLWMWLWIFLPAFIVLVVYLILDYFGLADDANKAYTIFRIAIIVLFLTGIFKSSNKE